MKIGDTEISFGLKKITIACGYDKYVNGEKNSNFISADFDVPIVMGDGGYLEQLSINDLSLAALELSREITKTTYLTALGRGAMTKDEYKILCMGSNTRHDEIIKAIEKKRAESKDGTDS